MDEYELAVWGSAGHAKVIAEAARLRGRLIIALFDNDVSARSVLPGIPLFIGEAGFEAWVRTRGDAKSRVVGLAAIGGARGRDRLSIHRMYERHGVGVAPALVHPTASVAETARIGRGSQVLAMAVVASDAVIGEGCILNHRSNADHESKLGDGVHLAPGATLCGCVTLGDHVMVGAGAVVLPRITVGRDAIIGAGAVVTRDVPPSVVVVGNPARVVRAV